MGIIKDFIEILFIIAAFRTLKKSREEIKIEIESINTSTFIFKWLFHLVLLWLYWIFKPLFPLMVVVFIVLQISHGLWILINKESFFSTYDKIPEIIDKIFPLAYLLYFGYNFIAIFISFLLW